MTNKNLLITTYYEELFNDIKHKDINSQKEFIDLTFHIMENEEFLKLQNIRHHLHTTRLMHSLHVAYCSYYTCKKNNLDYKSITRAAILHDFFHIDNNYENLINRYLLGYSHPKMAANKALDFYDLNKLEYNCIIRHMFPLTFIPPKYKEAWIIIYWDKIWGIRECFKI